MNRNIWKRAVIIGGILGMFISGIPMTAFSDEIIEDEERYAVDYDTEEKQETEIDELYDETGIIDDDDSLIIEENDADIESVTDESLENQELLAASGEGVYEKLMSLRSKYPDGKFWNHYVASMNDVVSYLEINSYYERYADTVTDYPCSTHNGFVFPGYDCNNFDGGIQCCGFAKKIFYELFGERESSNSLIRHPGASGLSVGDYVHFTFEHYAIVLEDLGDTFTVVECNLDGSGPAYNCKIRWGWRYNKSQIDYYVHSNNYSVIDNTTVTPSWENKTSNITTNNAVLSTTVSMPYQGNFSLASVILWGPDGTKLADKTENVNYNFSYMNAWYDVQAELGVTLSPGTTYKYQFTAVFNGTIYKSDVWSLKTDSNTVTPTWENKTNSITTNNAVLSTTVSMPYQGTFTLASVILWDHNGAKLAEKTENVSYNYSYMNAWYDVQAELGVTLSPGTTYKYQFTAVFNGNTYKSNVWNFKTESEAVTPQVKSNIVWADSYNFPSKYSALLCVNANSSITANYSEASIKIWDRSGDLIASKTENVSANALSTLSIWYDVYSETGSMLIPASEYTYQFAAKVNGYDFLSPVYSFKTENEDQNHYGIDVSSHQGNIDWATASQYIDFAIIRCGYGSDYGSNDDVQWIKNVTACEQYGIPYGVYLYSYAENTKEAESEADHVIRLLAGHNLSLPVYLDLENDNTVGRLSNSQILEQTKVFCTKIQQAGYSTGVYASKSWWDNKLTSSEYNNYEKWVAIYSGSYARSMQNSNMWQYSSTGRIPGINTNVDLDYRRENVVLASQCAHSTINYKNVIPATCDKPGYTGDIYCKNCGVYLRKGLSVDPLGHDFSNNAEYCRRGCGSANPNYNSSENPSSGSIVSYDSVAKALGENGDPAGSTFSILQVKNKKVKKTSITLAWKAVPKATGYVVYGAPCGSRYSRLKEVKGTSFTQSGLRKGKYYKYFVAAHDKNGKILASSKTVHIATSGGKKGNTKSVKLNKKKATLKKGRTIKLKAILKNGKLKVSKHRKVVFETDNPRVATVSKSGKVKAIGKGKCTVYAYAQNGVFAKCKITVK